MNRKLDMKWVEINNCMRLSLYRVCVCVNVKVAHVKRRKNNGICCHLMYNGIHSFAHAAHITVNSSDFHSSLGGLRLQVVSLSLSFFRSGALN